MTDNNTKSQLVKEREALCFHESVPGKKGEPYLLMEAWQEEKGLNEQLLDALPHPALLVHRDRTVLAANRMAREKGIKTGGTCWREFMRGQFISEEDKCYLAQHNCPQQGGIKCTFCLGDKALATHQSLSIEVSMPDGLWETWWVPVASDIYLHYAINVTKHKQIEDALRKSEAFISSVFDSISDMISVQDTEYNIIKLNRIVKQTFGNDLLGKKCYQVYQGRDTICPDCAMAKVLATGKQAFSAEQSGNGSIVEISAFPVRDEQGNIIAVVEHGRDISLREQLVQSISRYRQRNETLIDSIDGIVWEASVAPLSFSFVNKQAELILGYPVQNWLAAPTFWESRIYPDDHKQVVTAFSQAIFRQKPVALQHRMVTAGGQTVWLNGTITPVVSNGQTVKLQGVMVDITKAQKTQELLQHSQLLASLGEMTAGIAHEVNNPLSSILLYSELLMANDIEGQVKKDLKVIHEEAKRAARIMTDLLTYSSRSNSEVRRLNLHSILKKVLNIRRYGERVRNITVSTDFVDSPLYVRGDANQFMQVFMNILLNAEEALHPHNGGNILVTTEVDGEWGRVSIADNGIGIAKKDLERVFFPFFTTKPTGQGTGLGLSICYGIVTANKGVIHAANNEMGGATILVDLPLAKSRERRVGSSKKR